MLKFSTRLVLRLNAYFSGWIPVSIVCCSMRAIDNHIKKGFPENKICYIPNGFNTETFTPSSLEQKCALRKQYGLSSKKVLLGMMARYDDQKDYPNLLRAFAILSQQNDTVFLIMCGKGLNKENHVLTKLIESLQLQSRVQMIDGVDQPVDIYQMLDFFVLSSRTEGFPNVVGEAMSCGLPCVVTDVGDAAYLVNNGGDVVAKERPDFLAQACQKMLALSSEEMAELGAQARAKIMGNFSLESTVNQYVKLYEG
ncbi:MAG: glycosyltransferase [Gammaproteobacteria bacterium]|nr:glycosyltransferase [Gammaproteobacteria bacterium]